MVLSRRACHDVFLTCLFLHVIHSQRTTTCFVFLQNQLRASKSKRFRLLTAMEVVMLAPTPCLGVAPHQPRSTLLTRAWARVALKLIFLDSERSPLDVSNDANDSLADTVPQQRSMSRSRTPRRQSSQEEYVDSDYDEEREDAQRRW